jgi:hypothetical protein
MQAQPIDLSHLRAEDLRDAARFVEETALEPLADLADEEFPLVFGNVGSGRFFPRESPQQRAAVRGIAVLQDATAEAVAALYALAEARARDIVLPRAALLLVEPYLLAYLDTRQAGGGEVQQGQQDDDGVPAEAR